MFQRENWIILCINTIIVVVILIILFRQQDNKLKLYLRRIEKKLSYQKQNNSIERKYFNNNIEKENINKPQNQVINQNINENINQNINENISTQMVDYKESTDMDSFYDPMQN